MLLGAGGPTVRVARRMGASVAASAVSACATSSGDKNIFFSANFFLLNPVNYLIFFRENIIV